MTIRTQLKKSLCVASAATAVVALPAMATSPDIVPEGTYTFKGKTTLTAPNLQPVTCTLTLTGDVDNVPDSGDSLNGEAVYIDVTDGHVSGSFGSGCKAIHVKNFKSGWEAQTEDEDLDPHLPLGPFPFTFEDVTVTYPGGSCTGDVEAKFWNGQSNVGQTSYFTFDDDIGTSDCHVTTQSPGLTNQTTTDVNIQ